MHYRNNCNISFAAQFFIGMFTGLFIFSGLIYAESPVGLLPYQARLTDSNNNPLSGTYNLTFNICDSAASDCTAAPGQLWTETQNSISVDRGLVSVNLGNTTPIPMGIFTSATTYLEIQVGADPAMSPRIRLLPTPYSFNAQTIQGYDFTGLVSTFTSQQIAGNKTFTGNLSVSSINVQGTVTSTSGFIGGNSFFKTTSISSLSVVGSITSTSSFASGNADIAGNANISGLVNIGSMSVYGTVSSTSGFIGGNSTFQTTSISSLSVVGSITSTSSLKSGSADILGLVNIGSMSVYGTVSSTSGFIGGRSTFTALNVGPTNFIVTPFGYTGIGTLSPGVSLAVQGAIAIPTNGSIDVITSDDFLLSVGNRSYIRLDSNDTTNTNRTFCLTAGLHVGQILILQWTHATNEGHLADNANTCGGSGTTPQLNTLWPAAANQIDDSITLIWNGSAWIELARIAN